MAGPDGSFDERWADFLANDPTLKRMEMAAARADEIATQATQALHDAAAREASAFQKPNAPTGIPVPITNVSSWTPDTVKEHLLALRQADKEFNDERDRRYTEVAQEREKALKIKDEADKNALLLARQIQDYKDEKANELRSQIEREQGDRATKDDLKKLEEKFSLITRTHGLDSRAIFFGIVGLLLIVGQIVAALAAGHVI